MKIANVRIIFGVLSFSVITLSCGAAEVLKESDWTGPGYVPKDGFVPDKKTAISIAMAVLSPIYGKDTIVGEQPLVATLTKGIWTVTGSLPKRHVGGVAEIRISKASGEVLKVSHGK
jgi:hypothetical protein